MALTKRALLALLLMAFGAGAAHAQTASSGGFTQWLQSMELEAVADGISPDVARAALENATFEDHVIELDEKQPETTITFESYLHRTVTPERVSEGRRLLHENAEMLNAVSSRYGVQPEIIVALWGIESSFGRRSGDFTVIDSLATLAYAGRRADFFRKELLNALRILDQNHMPPESLFGSWAGAMGQCQFMPSTYLRFAVTYTGTGSPDIWENTGDVFASIAHYIAADGWHGGEDWGVEVHPRRPVAEEEIGLGLKHSLAEWSRLGVDDPALNAMGADSVRTASLIAPDGPSGRYFLVYNNFRALMQWNRSTFFATSVGLLADRISDDRS